jgi:hypothetical protein
MFGHVETVFGKHKVPRSLQESRGEAARRALQWIERLGMLPRAGLDHGLGGASSYPNLAYQQSVFGTAIAHHMHIPADVDFGLASTNRLHQSSSGSPPTMGVPTWREGRHSEISFGFEHASHKNSQSTLGSGGASSMKTSRKQDKKPAQGFRRLKLGKGTGGPTSSAANTIPLKRRRLPEKPTSSPKEAAAPVLTKQGLMSRMSLHKEHMGRVTGKMVLLEHATPSHKDHADNVPVQRSVITSRLHVPNTSW